MSKFFNEHPFIALVMVIFVCDAVVETATVIANGEGEVKVPFFTKAKKEEQKVESVGE